MYEYKINEMKRKRQVQGLGLFTIINLDLAATTKTERQKTERLALTYFNVLKWLLYIIYRENVMKNILLILSSRIYPKN